MITLCVFLLAALSDRGIFAEQTDPTQNQREALYKALTACIMHMRDDPHHLSGIYCSRAWDDVMCWPDTPANTTATQKCASYVQHFNTDGVAERRCTADGTWAEHPDPTINSTFTNLSNCFTGYVTKPNTNIHALIQEHIPVIAEIFLIGYSVSLVFLTIAIAIIIYFKKLHCERNYVHINLFLSFLLRGAIEIIKQSLLVDSIGLPQDLGYDEHNAVYFKANQSHWECKLLHTVHHYTRLANYVWIFVEGLYLYMLIYSVFSRKGTIWCYIIFGWASPVLPVVVWVIVKVFLDDVLCWNIHMSSGYIWITEGPITFSILVNFVFFLRIVWALFTKLRTSSRLESREFRYRRMARSTLVLIPLFGVHFVVSVILLNIPPHVRDKNPRLELFGLYFESIVTSFQGLFVSMLFCFFNGEVQLELTRRFHSRRASVVTNMSTVTRDPSFRAPVERNVEMVEFLPKSNGNSVREPGHGFANGDARQPLNSDRD